MIIYCKKCRTLKECKEISWFTGVKMGINYFCANCENEIFGEK